MHVLVDPKVYNVQAVFSPARFGGGKESSLGRFQNMKQSTSADADAEMFSGVLSLFRCKPNLNRITYATCLN